jgi:lysophospholipase L1-like esterase
MSNQTYYQGSVRRFSVRSERARRFGLVLASLILAELFLHFLGAVSLNVRSVLTPAAERNTRWLEDTRMRLRSNPLWREHDANGYRNARAPQHADIVALGDSNTYGSFVAREAAWPQLLAGTTHESVYNMGVAGYGPAQYFLQIDDALRLSPKLVIVAVYLGNDFIDSFVLAQRNPEIRALAPSAASYGDSRPGEALRTFEREMARRYQCDEASPSVTAAGQPVPSTTGRWLSHHVMLYTLVRNLADSLWQQMPTNEPNARSTATSTAHCPTVVERDWRTALNVPLMSAALDRDDPRVQLGFEISRAALQRIRRRVSAAGVAMLVVLLPTKESVLWDRIVKPQAFRGLQKLVDNEDAWRSQLTEALRKEDVAVLDLLPALRDAHQQPYFENTDGHPNEAGHRLIAAEIGAYLSREGWGHKPRVVRNAVFH